jgi:hypothetical protein
MNIEQPLEVKIKNDTMKLEKAYKSLEKIENDLDTMNQNNQDLLLSNKTYGLILNNYLTFDNIKKNIDIYFSELSNSKTVKRLGIEDLNNISLRKFDELIESNKERLITTELFELNNRNRSTRRVLLHLLGLLVILVVFYIELMRR